MCRVHYTISPSWHSFQARHNNSVSSIVWIWKMHVVSMNSLVFINLSEFVLVRRFELPELAFPETNKYTLLLVSFLNQLVVILQLFPDAVRQYCINGCGEVFRIWESGWFQTEVEVTEEE